MAWLMLLIGMALIGLGAGAAEWLRHKERGPESEPPEGLSSAAAWEILSTPVEPAELGGRSERRRKGSRRGKGRFARGILVGAGVGLCLIALITFALPGGGRGLPAPPPGGAAAPKPPATSKTPSAPKPLSFTVVVDQGEAASTIAAKLRSVGLISDEDAFLRRVADRRVDTRLKAGTFIIANDATLDEVIDSLTA